jgi:threonine/homoserine/homoserine lactone efflux protein
MSTYALALVTLWLVHLMAVMSPGQSFLLVSRTALSAGRGPALAAAVGMGLGVIVWAVGALCGLALVFERAAGLYAAIKLLGGLYLIWLAVMVWRHATDPVEIGDSAGTDAQAALGPALRQAFFTQIANPKVAVFFGSIFVTVLPPDPPLWLAGVILLIVLFNEVAWYVVVALLFSAVRPRAAYLRVKPWTDRVMAGLLGLIGARLVMEARG